MKKWQLFTLIIMMFILGIVYIIREGSTPAVSFFPIDADSSIEQAATKLTLTSEEGQNIYEVDWESSSTSDKSMYLRQDVSLLFDNGRLRGVRSKWVQNSSRIKIMEKLTSEDSSHFQSISFHHGENHDKSDEIKSVQLMSYDELYVIDSPTTPIASFKLPASPYETEWKELLDRTSRQQLLFHWHQLLRHFEINISNYTSIPLVDLHKYNNKPLSNIPMEESVNIIGRLWEGLYKNYIIPAADPPQDRLDSYIPLILLDKKNTHLLVLFELNGKKEKLIQRIP